MITQSMPAPARLEIVAPNEQEQAWQRFGAALAGCILRDDQGNPVRRTLSDFMMMSTADCGTVAFKSRDTRNYVYLRPSGQLYVPRTNQAFHRGNF